MSKFLVVVVLGYLITFPHLATRYVEYRYLDALAPERTAVDPFVNRADCDRAVESFNERAVEIAASQQAVPRLLYRCQTETHLIWGW